MNKKSCDPVSSNCVIWQGPDIPCIKLCKGDSVTEIVYKLATELCTLMDMFKISNYDLTCLDQCPAPSSFQQLIQILIERICVCCNVTPPVTPQEGCPDCVVNIAPCFYYQNPQGDTITTMQLTDYVTAIGNRICLLVDQINVINETLIQLEERIAALEAGQTNLQTKNVTSSQLPSISPVCIYSSKDPVLIDVFLQELEKQFCELRTATGTPNEIFTAILFECAGLAQEKQLATGLGTMASMQGWVQSPKNLADVISNMWLTLCDIRGAVKNMKATCCGDGCEDIELSILATRSGNTLHLFLNGNIPAGFVECNAGGTLITVTDTNGNYFTTNVVLTSILNAPSGIDIDLSASSLNVALDFTVSANVCLKNATTNTTCQSIIQYVLANTLICPDPVTLIPTDNSIQYSFNHVAGTVTYTVKLYDSTGTVLVASNSHNVSSPVTVGGTFGGLTSGTVYRVEIVITAGSKTNTCPYQLSTTTGSPCDPPYNVLSNLSIP